MRTLLDEFLAKLYIFVKKNQEKGKKIYGTKKNIFVISEHQSLLKVFPLQNNLSF